MPRTLSEAEFNAIRDHVLQTAPTGLDETSFNRYIGPVMDGAIAEAENAPAKVEGSTLARFAAGAWQNLNPASMVKGVWNALPIPEAVGGSGLAAPVRTVQNIAAASMDQGRQAVDLAKQGRYSEAVGHGIATLPILGPAAAAAGEAIAAGDVAGGLGQGAGLLAALEAPRAAKAGATVVRALPESVAAAADAGAAGRVADVMSPKVGPNKMRFGNMAADVAPQIAQDLATDGAPLSRGGLHQMVQDKLAAATEALDAAHDARLKSASFPTKPLIDGLLEKRKALTSPAIEADQITPKESIQRSGDGTITPVKTGVPLGKDVIPPQYEARVASIDRTIADIQQLGPVASYDAIRTLRQAADAEAKAIYSPAVTTDFLKVQGGKLGAADAAGVMRDALATWDPATAKANAQYSVYRKASDVLDATEEVERTRPKVGRVIAARVLTTLMGERAAGITGAVGGYALAPVIETALSGGATTKLKTASMLTNLSSAIRSGNLARVDSALKQVKRLGVTAATVQGQATSPSGPQSQTTAGATP